MNPLFNLFNPRPIQNSFSQTSQSGILQDLQNFRQLYNQRFSMSPEQMVKNLISSGQMTQEQFNSLANQANAILGRK